MDDLLAIANRAIAEHECAQMPYELALLLSFGAGRTVIEIGSHKGGSLWAWQQVGARVISIDICEPPNQWGARFVQGDSHDSATRYRVQKQLAYWGQPGPPVEPGLVFIDGDHSYEGVKADWEMWGDLAPFVAFHDIDLRRPPFDGCGVDRLWRELAERWVCHLVEEPDWCGVGVVRGREGA